VDKIMIVVEMLQECWEMYCEINGGKFVMEKIL
jgi:hypothetical protein